VNGLCMGTYIGNATSCSDAGGGIDVLILATLSSDPDAGARATPSQDHASLHLYLHSTSWTRMRY
jgi:hypothetical protein